MAPNSPASSACQWPALQDDRGQLHLTGKKMKYAMVRTSLAMLMGVGSTLLVTLSSAVAWDPVLARNGMVVSQKSIASEIGVEVMKDGGTVVDAAVATAFALSVALPRAGNIGGGGFMLVRTAGQPVQAYDFRETAPASAHPDMFLLDGKYDRNLHQYSGRSIGVPGTVAGLYLAWQENGRLPWKRLVMPAVSLARDGVVVTGDMEKSFARHMPRWQNYPASVEKFTLDGAPYRVGDLFRQPVLAKTLKKIAEQGPKAFYHGEIADLIVDEVNRAGGEMTVQDLAAYQARKRVPIQGHYRGYEVFSMPPPSSGGVTLVEILNILEGFDLASMGAQSADLLHVEIESMRRGFSDRALHLGDPDFVKDMPLARLVDKSYADTLRATINMNRATKSIIQKPENNIQSKDTTHLSVADTKGNAVALTYTIEEPLMVVTGGGFLLNSELGDFNAAPGLTDKSGLIGTEPNLAEPGKRPLSSMTPTIVTHGEDLFLVTGSPGDRTIISTVLQTIVNSIDFGMDAMSAVTLGRIHHGWMPDEVKYDNHAIPPNAKTQLEARGHRITEVPIIGYAQVIRYDAEEDVLEGGPDPRNADSGASGY